MATKPVRPRKKQTGRDRSKDKKPVFPVVTNTTVYDTLTRAEIMKFRYEDDAEENKDDD